ncbi:hypothetical protein NE237_028530 [Protea cynaroides]|uniref:Uncharacterized protein n=1 Tax=Protea cynaroides TaxID=273540 RepID=A0A9Q0GS74_9MAGN|nr:hypothetical protein NE237_028530 [Protea cynaroides]
MACTDLPIIIWIGLLHLIRSVQLGSLTKNQFVHGRYQYGFGNPISNGTKSYLRFKELVYCKAQDFLCGMGEETTNLSQENRAKKDSSGIYNRGTKSYGLDNWKR